VDIVCLSPAIVSSFAAEFVSVMAVAIGFLVSRMFALVAWHFRLTATVQMFDVAAARTGWPQSSHRVPSRSPFSVESGTTSWAPWPFSVEEV
jgi:hypothetical protein